MRTYKKKSGLPLGAALVGLFGTAVAVAGGLLFFENNKKGNKSKSKGSAKPPNVSANAAAAPGAAASSSTSTKSPKAGPSPAESEPSLGHLTAGPIPDEACGTGYTVKSTTAVAAPAPPNDTLGSVQSSHYSDAPSFSAAGTFDAAAAAAAPPALSGGQSLYAGSPKGAAYSTAGSMASAAHPEDDGAAPGPEAYSTAGSTLGLSGLDRSPPQAGFATLTKLEADAKMAASAASSASSTLKSLGASQGGPGKSFNSGPGPANAAGSTASSQGSTFGSKSQAQPLASPGKGSGSKTVVIHKHASPSATSAALYAEGSPAQSFGAVGAGQAEPQELLLSVARQGDSVSSQVSQLSQASRSQASNAGARSNGVSPNGTANAASQSLPASAKSSAQQAAPKAATVGGGSTRASSKAKSSTKSSTRSSASSGPSGTVSATGTSLLNAESPRTREAIRQFDAMMAKAVHDPFILVVKSAVSDDKFYCFKTNGSDFHLQLGDYFGYIVAAGGRVRILKAVEVLEKLLMMDAGLQLLGDEGFSGPRAHFLQVVVDRLSSRSMTASTRGAPYTAAVAFFRAAETAITEKSAEGIPLVDLLGYISASASICGAAAGVCNRILDAEQDDQEDPERLVVLESLETFVRAGKPTVTPELASLLSQTVLRAADCVNSDDAARAIRLLADIGAPVDLKASDSGMSPLHVAVKASAGNPEKMGALRALVEAKHDLEVSDMEGRTPLALAAFLGYDHVVEALILAGANIDSVVAAQRGSQARPKMAGYTPLGLSCFAFKESKGHHDFVRCIELLVKAGASKTVPLPVVDGAGGLPANLIKQRIAASRAPTAQQSETLGKLFGDSQGFVAKPTLWNRFKGSFKMTGTATKA